MNTFVYTIPVVVEEGPFLLEALRQELLIAESRWELEEDSFVTGECCITVSTLNPLSLMDRRKIVSCGLSVRLIGLDPILDPSR